MQFNFVTIITAFMAATVVARPEPAVPAHPLVKKAISVSACSSSSAAQGTYVANLPSCVLQSGLDAIGFFAAVSDFSCPCAEPKFIPAVACAMKTNCVNNVADATNAGNLLKTLCGNLGGTSYVSTPTLVSVPTFTALSQITGCPVS